MAKILLWHNSMDRINSIGSMWQESRDLCYGCFESFSVIYFYILNWKYTLPGMNSTDYAGQWKRDSGWLNTFSLLKYIIIREGNVARDV